MAATAGGTPARRTATKSTRAKATAAKPRVQLPHPPPPLEETLGRGPRANGTGPADTDADVVMLPGGFSFEPIRFEEEDAPEKIRVPLFYGPDGDEYTVWANPPPRVGLKYMDEFARLGGDAPADAVATHWLMVQLIGEDGHAALLQMKGLDRDRYAKIIAILQRISLGPLESPKDAGSE